ncbi:DUF4232 domain-containing protein [Streptomyces sp. URMC 123]
MGLRVMNLELVNRGTTPYTVKGYPPLRVLDDARKPLDVKVGKGSFGISVLPSFDAAPQQVTLQPGEKAVAGIVWRNTVTGYGAPVNGKHLSVAPADGQGWQTVTPDAPVDIGTTGKLGVSPWAKPSDRPAS